MVGTRIPRHRSLWPREHGAYFQLAIPLVTAYLLHGPTIAMLALTSAACLAFLAHEPLLVALGHRGPRMRDRDGDRARRRLVGLSAGALATGGAGLALAPREAAVVLVVVAVPVLAVVALAWRRAEHTVAGEVVAAVALTGASVPVLVAGGAAPGAALALWLAWALGFAAMVLAVHRVIARHRRAAAPVDRVLALGFTATVAACVVLAPRVAAAAILVPVVALAALLVIAPPPATRLRAVGIASVVAAAGAAAIAAVAAVA